MAIVLAGAALAPTSARAGPVPEGHSCLGRWQGVGRNTGSATSWTIDLTLASNPDGGRCGTIEYTNPRCGGYLERCRLVGNEIHTREVYTHRDPNCAAAAQVIIRCDGPRLHYSWIGWERVNSVLHRAGAPGQAEPGPAQPGVTPPTDQAPSPSPTVPSAGPAPPPPITPQETPETSRPTDDREGGLLGCAAVPAPGPARGLWTCVAFGLCLVRARRSA